MENEMEHARKFLAMLENGKHLAVFSIFIERIATLKWIEFMATNEMPALCKFSADY